eukprot:TCONS_00070940-protein
MKLAHFFYITVALWLSLTITSQDATEQNTFLWDSIYDSLNCSVLNTFTTSVDRKCTERILEVCEHNTTRMKYFDANGKPASGILAGNVYWLGDYNECLGIPNSTFCTIIDLKIVKHPAILGTCFPMECTPKDIHFFFKNIAGYINEFSGNNTMVVADKPIMEYYGTKNLYCVSNGNTQMRIGTILALVFTSIIVLLTTIGTLVHLYDVFTGVDYSPFIEQFNPTASNIQSVAQNANDQATADPNEERVPVITIQNLQLPMRGPLPKQLVLCFSLISNIEAILTTKTRDGVMKVLNSVRVISLCWVVIGHMLFYAPLYSPVDNSVYVYNSWLKLFPVQIILSSTLAVDSFFLVSGCLACIQLLTREALNDRKTIKDYFLMISHRLLRLLPAYMFVILFYTYIFPHMSSGPFWFPHREDSSQVSACKKYWWSNLLFVNEFVFTNFDEGCIPWSWYLAVDTMFYLFNPLFVYLVKRIKGIVLMVVGIVLSIGLKGYVLYYYHATPLFNTETYRDGIEQEDPKAALMKYLNHIYIKPYFRISPYLVGIMLGYVIFKKIEVPRTKSRKLKAYSVTWLLSIAFSFLAVFAPSITANTFSEVSIVFYGIFFRLLWSIAVAWMIYACHIGYAGIIADMLCSKLFIPLYRVTYSAYLCHVLVIIYFFGSLQTPIHFNDTTFGTVFAGMLVVIYISGFLIAVFVEFPVYNLEKVAPKWAGIYFGIFLAFFSIIMLSSNMTSLSLI